MSRLQEIRDAFIQREKRNELGIVDELDVDEPDDDDKCYDPPEEYGNDASVAAWFGIEQYEVDERYRDLYNDAMLDR